MDIVLIAAVGKELQLGRDNQLLWHLPGDLPRFKELTMGSPIIMGRKTYESIGKPLPGRQNIVITRDQHLTIDGVTVAHSSDHAIAAVNDNPNKVFVIGGGEIYSLFIDKANILELTEVDDSPPADAFFPGVNSSEWQEIAREAIADTSPTFSYVTYRRI